MLAADLLKRMADTYATLPAYADSGVVSRIVSGFRTRSVDTGTFATRFDRRGRFRFEFRNDSDPLSPLVLKNGFKAIQDERARMGSFAALVRNYLETMGTFQTIASLLVPVAGSPLGLFELEKSSYQGEGILAGRRCHRIHGRRHKTAVTLWLDAEKLLLHRCLESGERGYREEREQVSERRRHGLAAGIDRDLVDRHLDPRRLVPPRERDSRFKVTTVWQPEQHPR